MVLEMEDFSFHLRKINAIKIHHEKDKPKKEVSKKKKTKRLLQEVAIHLKQKEIQEQDKKLELRVDYRIPSISKSDVEIDAEFIGSISLNEPLEIEDEEDLEKSPRFKEFLDKILAPKIFKELDKILSPLFNSMNVEYESMSQKIKEGTCESENPS